MAIKSIITLFLSFFFADVAYSASFNCKQSKNLNEAESLICSRPSLSKLDDHLNEIFQSSMRRVLFKKHLRQEQRVWIQERNHDYSFCNLTSEVGIDGEDYCPNQLKQIYELRIKRLLKSHEKKISCLSGQTASMGVFSGDWLFEEFGDGKRWMHTISIIQLGKKLNGAWMSGGQGGVIASGSLKGTVQSDEGSVEYCEDFPSNYCVKFKAKVADQTLTLFRCRNTNQCEKKSMPTLYQKSTIPCDAFPPKLK